MQKVQDPKKDPKKDHKEAKFIVSSESKESKQKILSQKIFSPLLITTPKTPWPSPILASSNPGTKELSNTKKEPVSPIPSSN